MVDNNNNTSLESRALGGMNNPQQTQNFLTALKQSGAGNNNTFMSSNPQQQAQPQNLVDPNAVKYNNGSGPSSYMKNFNNMNPITQITMPQSMAVPYSQVPVNNGILNNVKAMQPQTQSGNSGVLNNVSQMQPQNQTQLPINPIQNVNPYVQAYNQNAQLPYNPYATTNTGNNYSQLNQMNPYSYVQNSQYINPMGQMQQMSDETQKEHIKAGDNKVYQFLDSIKAHQYEYKDKKFGEGKFISPMAQELEKTEAGKSAVINTPEGKMVNYGRLSGITLASMAVINEDNKALRRENQELNTRMQKIESQLKLKKRAK